MFDFENRIVKKIWILFRHLLMFILMSVLWFFDIFFGKRLSSGSHCSVCNLALVALNCMRTCVARPLDYRGVFGAHNHIYLLKTGLNGLGPKPPDIFHSFLFRAVFVNISPTNISSTIFKMNERCLK